MHRTIDDWERLAYIEGDARSLSLIDQLELERDDPVAPETLSVQEEGWDSNAWCLARVADALCAAAPLGKPQMRLLAQELQGLADQLPCTDTDRSGFKGRIDRILQRGE